jgi:hypothetical protein
MPASRLHRGRLATVAVAIAALVGAEGAWAAPSVPLTDDVVLERLPVVAGPIAAELRRLREQATAPPDLATALTTAERLLTVGQTRQDPRYVGYASAALRPWWSLPVPPPEVLVLRAAVRQHRHDFDAALIDLDLALRQDPGNPKAWVGRATVLLVQGRPAETLAACGALERTAASIVGTVCRAAAMARLGQAPAALALLETTLARSPALEPVIERWGRTELAELFRLVGRPAPAEAELRAALRLEPQDAYAANALADLLLAQGRPQEALDVLGADFSHDGKLLRAALAARMLGNPAWRHLATQLEQRFAAARLRGDAIHLREEARFCLELRDRPAQALALAVENWRQQREPADLRVLLASAVAADDPKAAAPALAWLDSTGFVDPGLEPLVHRLRGAPG